MDLAFATKFLGALFAIMNPFINLPIFLAITSDETVDKRRVTARHVVLYTAIMCFIISMAGASILSFFGISTDAFRVAGGIVLLGIALSMLNGQPITGHERGEHEKQAEAASNGDGDSAAFYPMTFPMIVGPGTIATLIVYAAQAHEAAQIVSFVIVLCATLTALLVVLYVSSSIGRLLSAKIRVVMTRLMGMILAAIAVEMILAGTKALMPGLG
ncbi:NAAT family transporter [Bradyrhizobium pachyrhizi]|uniref:UPF0056 membrane protein n=1 Tax=Bradyrhizobium pachyrhizi TaxID=280333 RepID=A0A844SR88_9BRAD|nr:MarC family protein [Bradyrhizobium pachyrhizi]MVT64940.1 NAAT family transporter [Bradyrhizobium pachyrhizi]